MFTNAPMLAAMVVFAGGPHTESRTDLACSLISRCQPELVYLTGAEYQDTSSNLVSRMRELTRVMPGPPRIETDTCSSTFESCQRIARDLHTSYPQGADITLVTSDYHAARARWLLSSALPKEYRITVYESKDISSPQRWSTPQNRRLIRGEWLSWMYCLPLGWTLRHGLIATAVLAAIAAIAILHLYRRVQSALCTSAETQDFP